MWWGIHACRTYFIEICEYWLNPGEKRGMVVVRWGKCGGEHMHAGHTLQRYASIS